MVETGLAGGYEVNAERDLSEARISDLERMEGKEVKEKCWVRGPESIKPIVGT